MTSSAASIIIPTYKEAENIRPLVERIVHATDAAGIQVEILIIDDNSQDGVLELCRSLQSAFPLRILVREHERGLAGAVIAGFGEARYEQLVVLDADLQHPPEAIPRLLERLNQPGCDFAIATRYAGGGAINASWSHWRRLVSRAATWLARPLAPLSDPMSGFFAIRRATFQRAAPLNPVGYKIALELYVKCGCRNPGEIPIEFSVRAAGKSKAGIRQGLHYMRHLWRLYWFRRPAAMLLLTSGFVFILAAIVFFWYRFTVR